VIHVCVFIYSEGLDSKSSRVVGAYVTAGHCLQSLFFQIIDCFSPHQSYRIELLLNLHLVTFNSHPTFATHTIIVKSPTLDANFNSFHIVVGHIVIY
jgi:hypothetical protein